MFVQVSLETKGATSSGMRVLVGCEPPDVSTRSHTGSLKEQYMLLTTKASLQPHLLFV